MTRASSSVSSRTTVLALVLIAGCGHSDDPFDHASTETKHGAAASFHEDMVGIHGGRFEALGLRCPPGAPADLATASQDYRRTEHEGSPFDIDRHLVTCAEYRACVAEHGCRTSDNDCYGFSKMPLGDAKQFCAWRGVRLPSFLEWQRAVLGVRGEDIDGAARPCEPDERAPHEQQDALRCRLVSEAGVEFSLQGSFGGEWTRDTDCYEHHGAVDLHAVGIDTYEDTWPQGMILGGTNPAMSSGVFRCVRDTVSLDQR